uniref:Uncharacterized protein n=1 Tax=Glossina palpalis gambiensis TaxID=67801 RepID=A0A1B0B4L6_9MUSC
MSPHYQRDTLIGFILLIYSLVACSTVLAVEQSLAIFTGFFFFFFTLYSHPLLVPNPKAYEAT